MKKLISAVLALILAVAACACSGTKADDTAVRIGSLKGPTTMGLVNLMKKADNKETTSNYEFTMETQADAIAAKIVSGDLDIALVPANLASALYKKTEGGIRVINVNTLGVLYCVTGDESIKSVKDLAGKEVVLTGQGTTPEYSLRYLLDKNGIADCTLNFKSEATEVAAVLAEDSTQIAVLPQPFATVAQIQNDKLHTAFSLSDEWDAAAGGESKLLTGVTIVRADFLKDHEGLVKQFLKDHAESAKAAVDDVEGTATLVAEYGIIEKAPVAQKALPYCNIVCLTGSEMKTALSGYLQVLFDSDAKAVGGALPADDFYYIGG